MNSVRSPRHERHPVVPGSPLSLVSTPIGYADQLESGSFGLRELVFRVRRWVTGRLLHWPPSFPPQDGTAPLWIASQMGHSEVVRVMLLRGADRDAARNVSRQRPPPPTCRLVFQLYP